MVVSELNIGTMTMSSLTHYDYIDDQGFSPSNLTWRSPPRYKNLLDDVSRVVLSILTRFFEKNYTPMEQKDFCEALIDIRECRFTNFLPSKQPYLFSLFLYNLHEPVSCDSTTR